MCQVPVPRVLWPVSSEDDHNLPRQLPLGDSAVQRPLGGSGVRPLLRGWDLDTSPAETRAPRPPHLWAQGSLGNCCSQEHREGFGSVAAHAP